jgi:hypothetical protein
MGTEPAAALSSARERAAPWIEGSLLALLLLAVVTLGGDSLRTSYHGTLHTAIGESVLREGLAPENPYHAGEPLRYYLLYPLLGVLAGLTGIGPLWGFALLNLLAALLLGPSLDALGRNLGLSFRARRFAFLWTILGLNGLGWLWASVDGGPLLDLRSLDEPGTGPGLGAMPLVLLQGMSESPFGPTWDARLQSFLPKFLNVSSFAPALPFTLWSMAYALRSEPRALWGAAAHLGVATALNPLAGALAAVLLALRNLGRLRRPRAALRALAPPALLAALIAIPFLLPAMHGGGAGEGGGAFALTGDGPLANLTGPLILLWLLAAFGLHAFARDRLIFLGTALGLALLLGCAPLPWGNEYKFVRLGALLLALPAGAASARLWERLPGRAAVAILLLLTRPTTWLTVRAYSAWNAAATLVLTRVVDGRLALGDEFAAVLPAALQAAEHALPEAAVLLADPFLNPTRTQSLVALGHPLAPLIHRPLLVDRPQIHNEAAADLVRRLDAWVAFAFASTRPLTREQRPQPADPHAGLAFLRACVPGRPLAVLVSTQQQAARAALERAGAELRAEAEGLQLWLLPPSPAAAGN